MFKFSNTSLNFFCRKAVKTRIDSFISNPSRTLACNQQSQSLSTLANPTDPSVSDVSHVSQEEESLYPPIKPKYPAGRWKNISEESAWKIHEISHSILQIPKAKERLEFLAGEDDRTLWLVAPLAPRPNNLSYQKILTKSHIMPDYPNLLKSVNVNGDILSESMSLIDDLHHLESISVNHGYSKLSRTINPNFDDQHLHNFLVSSIKSLVAFLSGKNEHLLRCEIDENVRVESFWRVTGFEGDKKSCDGSWDIVKTVNDIDAGVLQFQYRHNANLQIRTELPLNQFVSMDDNTCIAQDPYIPMHAPEFVGIKSIKDRPVNVSGHWIGSPCEFTTCSVHLMPSQFVDKFLEYGSEYLREAEELMALTTMFGSCLAQAHNQGFCDMLDLTYPITTQSVIVNKEYVRFACYQLNTLQMWNDANPLQNLMWISEPVSMLSKSSDNAQTLSKQFVEFLLRSILIKPHDREINLRPYLPDEESPVKTKFTINFKGEKPFEHPVIGRWQYPKRSIYF
ncbi:hypothetical protein HELRODRAFT_190373 [Helobdella robusta]|uniref:Uncharacterized protein n=1 Tax=Helobdella robusta TaxID=6412 RepID=T1FRX9_HELRO|nr:hypothetical protein HELRODRAFT_190373 [Helobdella robusta]ESO10084.1 hypothetical protein HELRODRAFT_190373 [Helobdella robusta]